MTGFSAKRLWEQAKALPFHLKVWLGWLTVGTMLIPLALIGNDLFAALMVCQAANVAFGTTLALRYGLVRLLGLSHLIFWTPMLLKFGWFYDALDTPLLLLAGWVVIATVAVSLVLDARDMRDWLRGERGPIS